MNNNNNNNNNKKNIPKASVIYISQLKLIIGLFKQFNKSE